MWESFQGSRRGRIACKKRSSGFGGKNPIVSRATTDNLCELSTVERDEPLRIEAGSRGSSGAVKFSRGPTESLSRPKRSEHVELKEERKQEEERRVYGRNARGRKATMGALDEKGSRPYIAKQTACVRATWVQLTRGSRVRTSEGRSSSAPPLWRHASSSTCDHACVHRLHRCTHVPNGGLRDLQSVVTPHENR